MPASEMASDRSASTRSSKSRASRANHTKSAPSPAPSGGGSKAAKASRAESELDSAIFVRKSGIQGRGVFAARDIPKGSLIVEYLGKRMTHDEVGDRYDDEASRRHHTFLFSVDDELCIDGSIGGNEARLINHSCEPNAFAEIEKKRIFIRSLRRISEGEEIVYDYWYSTDPAYTLDDLKRIYPCKCGAETCRGTLAAPPKKPRTKKAAARKSARNGSR